MIGFTAPLKQEIARLKSREQELFERIDDLEDELTTSAIKNLELRGEMAKLRTELFEAQSKLVSIPLYTEVQPV